MANNVTTYISIQGNEHVVNAFKTMQQQIKTDGSVNAFYNDSLDTYEWYYQNVGAKWCYIEDFPSDEQMTVVSAWNYPEQFINHLLQLLSEYDPNVAILTEFDDEYYNFIGISKISKFFAFLQIEENLKIEASETDNVFEYIDGVYESLRKQLQQSIKYAVSR